MNGIIKVDRKGGSPYWTIKQKKGTEPFKPQATHWKKIQLNEEDIVADIGAYVGDFSLYASEQGVKKVYSYEPTPETFRVLQMNKRDQIEVFNYAVTGKPQKSVTFYISSGIGVTNSIAKAKRKAYKIEAKAIDYTSALRDATIVKIDVEGAEYSYPIIQPQLRGIILEFHPLQDKPWRTWADKIIQDLQEAGFKALSTPTFESGWNLEGAWIRE